jgi:hypothetical protein
MNSPPGSDGSMALSVAILAVLIIVVLIVIVTLVVPGFIGGASIGLRTANVPYAPQVTGTVMGYADVSGQVDGIEVYDPSPDPSLLGSVTIPIQIQYFMTTNEAPPQINMNPAVVYVSAPSGTETLYKSNTRPLEKPSWTIAQQNSLAPLLPPNNNDILEPNEVFVIMVYPGAAMPPGEPVSILISIPGQWPLTVNFTVPDPVLPEMTLKYTLP